MTDRIILGAVAYDPKVVTIWEGFKDFFQAQGLKFDYILYSNYESQVRGHWAGQCNVAWNSPLAWIEAERLAARNGRRASAIVMRDSDLDLASVVVVKNGSGIDSIAGLRGMRIATGAADSPQATLIPLEMLAQAGLLPGRDFTLTRFDIGLGKHGDHVGGERDAAKALMAGTADACCILDANRLLFAKEAVLPTGVTRVLAETGRFDHCNFTVFDDAPAKLIGHFTELLLAMRFDDPAIRPLLEMEGLKQWLPGRVSGYNLLNQAVDRAGGLEHFLPD